MKRVHVPYRVDGAVRSEQGLRDDMAAVGAIWATGTAGSAKFGCPAVCSACVSELQQFVHRGSYRLRDFAMIVFMTSLVPP
ncbi:hypothetical protein TSUKUMMB_32080 [Rhodococcus sp. no. 34]